MLRHCLDSLLALRLCRVDNTVACDVSLVVVENDDHERSQACVSSASARSPFPVHYCLEPDVGIAQARNRALCEALRLECHWLWFLDDDETAEPDCLLELINSALRHHADVVHGKIHYRYPASDRWAHLAREPRRPERDDRVIHSAATNNVLISSRLFSPQGLALQFDTSLRLCGGEDSLFFKQANAQGALMVFCASAVVSESVPESRCTLASVLDRHSGITASGVYADRKILGNFEAEKKHWRRFRQNLLQLLINTLAFPLLSLGALAQLKAPRVRNYFLVVALKAATLHGRWRGLTGRLPDTYRVIHGH